MNHHPVGLPERQETAWGTYVAAFAHLRLGDLASAETVIDIASMSGRKSLGHFHHAIFWIRLLLL